jgi:hypothetical protein
VSHIRHVSMTLPSPFHVCGSVSGVTSLLSHPLQTNGNWLKLAVVIAAHTAQLTGHAAYVVWFAMPPPSIRNVSYPQAKQCASVDVPT